MMKPMVMLTKGKHNTPPVEPHQGLLTRCLLSSHTQDQPRLHDIGLSKQASIPTNARL